MSVGVAVSGWEWVKVVRVFDSGSEWVRESGSIIF